MKGDWKAATNILDKKKCYVRFSINRNNETALHVAAYKGHTSFVKKLVILMNKEDLELQNNSYNTALCIAAIAGHVEVAKIIVTKQKALVTAFMDHCKEHTRIKRTRKNLIAEYFNYQVEYSSFSRG
ncbi:hypothetical protein L6452_40790 [Arctium lappa]|uniref:Uncharacterized protein n=1 Tax=Arctium lappa TaxID=4217 RepID=A0ACB8XMV4_ARCLA|nr:hypothetical protein L6452_40790 [Arctium lappa]